MKEIFFFDLKATKGKNFPLFLPQMFALQKLAEVLPQCFLSSQIMNLHKALSSNEKIDRGTSIVQKKRYAAFLFVPVGRRLDIFPFKGCFQIQLFVGFPIFVEKHLKRKE